MAMVATVAAACTMWYRWRAEIAVAVIGHKKIAPGFRKTGNTQQWFYFMKISNATVYLYEPEHAHCPLLSAQSGKIEIKEWKQQ